MWCVNSNTFVAVPHRSQTLFRCVFERFSAIEVLQRRTSVKGWAHMHYTDLSGIHASTLCVSAMLLTEVLHFECGKAIKIRNGIVFDFHSRLPHLVLYPNKWRTTMQYTISWELIVTHDPCRAYTSSPWVFTLRHFNQIVYSSHLNEVINNTTARKVTTVDIK